MCPQQAPLLSVQPQLCTAVARATEMGDSGEWDFGYLCSQVSPPGWSPRVSTTGEKSSVSLCQASAPPPAPQLINEERRANKSPEVLQCEQRRMSFLVILFLSELYASS